MGGSSESDEELLERILDLLLGSPATARQLAAGLGIDRSRVNRLIYAEQDYEVEIVGYVGKQPVWALIDDEDSDPGYPPPGTPSLAGYAPSTIRDFETEPYQWQKEAIARWRDHGHRGVVEAVTGTGKSRVGLMAIREALLDGRKAVVLVPSSTIARKWREKDLPQVVDPSRIGQLGDGRRDGLESCDVLVALVQSAFRQQVIPPTVAGPLLVADECHWYGAPSYADALDKRYEWRLGLTATLERSDDGVKQRLQPYFGLRPVITVDFGRARNDGIIAPYELRFVGVELLPDELSRYNEAGERMHKSARWLIENRKYPDVLRDPTKWGLFMQRAAAAAREGADYEERQKATSVVSCMTKRREILAESPAKQHVIRSLAPDVRKSKGAIVFTQTTTSAESAAAILTGEGVPASALHAGTEADERELVLQRFEAGNTRVLTAPRLLDEGVDLPDVDLGIVIAASRSRRQMIQRMGRVLRKQPGKRARFIVVYARGTAEDPNMGAHESFIKLAMDHADAVHGVRSKRSAAASSNANHRPDDKPLLDERSVRYARELADRVLAQFPPKQPAAEPLRSTGASTARNHRPQPSPSRPKATAAATVGPHDGAIPLDSRMLRCLRIHVTQLQHLERKRIAQWVYENIARGRGVPQPDPAWTPQQQKAYATAVRVYTKGAQPH